MHVNLKGKTKNSATVRSTGVCGREWSTTKYQEMRLNANEKINNEK